MISFVEGDIFDSKAQTLVNPVNTVGVMGKGLAAEFKRCYPQMFREYQALCKNGQFNIGKLWLYKTPERWILNFPTKRHWRDKSWLEDIETGLQRFVNTNEDDGITSIAFPMLGSGLGGLNWEAEVRPLMERYLQALPIDIEIYVKS